MSSADDSSSTSSGTISSDEESSHSSPDSSPKNAKSYQSYKQENYVTAGGNVANLKDRKNRKRSHYGEFIIMEAEVDDEADDGKELEDGEDDTDLTQDDVNEIEAARNDINTYKKRSQLWNFKNDTEIEEYFRKKYSSPDSLEKGVDERINPAIQQHALLPDINDPNIWMVPCRSGEEKSLALLLIRKYFAYAKTNEPLQIISVVAPEGKNGFIYIESYKENHVRNAIEDISRLKAGLYKSRILPLSEKIGIFNAINPKQTLQTDQLVRVKCGLYKNDVGQLSYIDLAQKKVIVKLLPRMRCPYDSDANENLRGEQTERRVKTRPPPKLLDMKAIRSKGGKIKSKGAYLEYNGNHYSHDGYIYKTLSISAIASDGIVPHLTELETFNINTENLKNAGSLTTKLVIGDKVRVCKGELENLLAVVSSINGDIVTITPIHKDLKNAMHVKYSELEKYFNVGDHVSVVSGHHKDEKGFVVRVASKHVILVSDTGNNELEVLINDVQLSSNIPVENDLDDKKYHLGDFVQINSYNVGVIVRLNKQNAFVLNLDGKVIECKMSRLQKRLNQGNKTVALDMNENRIMCKSIVTVFQGRYAGKTGEIKHLYRSYAFLYLSVCTENGGMFVSRTYHLKLYNQYDVDLRSPFQEPPKKPLHQRQTEKNEKNLVGKTITICKGMYKGSVGIVKFQDEKIARVELHSSCQSILVNLSHISSNDKGKNLRGTSSISRSKSHHQQRMAQTPVYMSSAANTPLIDSFVSSSDWEDNAFKYCNTRY